MEGPRDLRPASRGAAGFSMVEALIAAGILLIIAIGLLPLFTRAISDNSSGNDATQSTNGSRTRLEEMLAPPFLHAALTLPAVGNQKETLDVFTQGDPDQTGDANEGWAPNASGRGRTLWNRATRVRQYSIDALADGDFDDSDRLSGSTQPIFVHLKEVEVVIDNPKQGSILGTGQGVTLRLVRPF
jgi:Tfp pilus assembly protein PilV